MKFIEVLSRQNQNLVDVITIMKDLEKADISHSEECKHKEENKKRDGETGSKKRFKKMAMAQTKQR